MKNMIVLPLFFIAALCGASIDSSVIGQITPPKPAPTPIATIKAKVVPATIKGGDQLVVDASAAKGKVTFKHDFPAGTFAVEGKKLFAALPPKADVVHKFSVWLTYWDEEAQEELVVTVPGLSPTPTPPDDVSRLAAIEKAVNSLTSVVTGVRADLSKAQFDIAELQKKPVPPDPPKPPDPPVPTTGFRVLMVYDLVSVTPDQQGIVYGKKVRDYLQAKCAVGADGKTKDFWILPADVDTSAAPKWIGDTMQRHPGQRMYMVVIKDGKTLSDGPLPANAEEAMSILTKIGGQ